MNRKEETNSVTTEKMMKIEKMEPELANMSRRERRHLCNFMITDLVLFTTSQLTFILSQTIFIRQLSMLWITQEITGTLTATMAPRKVYVLCLFYVTTLQNGRKDHTLNFLNRPTNIISSIKFHLTWSNQKNLHPNTATKQAQSKRS